MPAFKQALLIRNQAKEDRRSVKIGEYVKIAIESVESQKPKAKSRDNTVSESKTSTIMVGTGI